jgi:insertion element IS1 protein InsB
MAEPRIMTHAHRTLIEHRVRARIALHGSCRAVGVSLPWLWHFIVEGSAACPDHLRVQRPAGPTAVRIQQLEADEVWSIVGKKANKPWSWIGMAAHTPQLIALHVGDRCRESAKELGTDIPVVHLEQASSHPAQEEAYIGVIPTEPHSAMTKQARKPKHRDRWHYTLRPRLSCLVGEPWPFSKKQANRLGAIRYFICPDQRTSGTTLPL